MGIRNCGKALKEIKGNRLGLGPFYLKILGSDSIKLTVVLTGKTLDDPVCLYDIKSPYGGLQGFIGLADICYVLRSFLLDRLVHNIEQKRGNRNGNETNKCNLPVKYKEYDKGKT